MSNKQKINSSIPGLVYPLARNEIIKTPYGFLKGRTQQDGAEGLWRIRNGLYDLRTFAKSHPGGAEWITLTKGTDITEAFEAHHLTEKAERILPKFYIRDATTLRSIPLTFEPNGFYRTFKKRALEALKDVDFHRPSKVSNFIADSFFAATVFFCLAAAYSHILSFIAIIIAGFFLAWTAVIGHNYFHMRDNFRMYYFDLSLMSSKDWRITHVLSHHLYPNTLWDYEIYAIEPLLKWLPDKNKNIIISFISQLSSPIIYALTFIQQGVKRYYSVIWEYGTVEVRDIVPFILPIAMSFVAPSIFVAFQTWIIIILISSFIFSFIGFNAAHHHPNIFHDGDIYRENLDWGLLELDAVREREIIDDVPLLVLTNFGSHGLHHLLPAVDHSYLPLTMPAFLQTCKEFGISTKRWTQWELLKGQFKQLARVECKKNHR
ncbi:cytochrome b5-related protein [Vespula pensylvanica]|uniref:cytochrome b5-related protein n=1 Tax=Vespula pensylvanica TaxID=30213 RepID=UPI001CBA04CF|nr:cytochrome b5-related protein [Vespula pensylvanica]XP_043684042.1 cytochrome b5-related protein [Vespula pensylvanica]